MIGQSKCVTKRCPQT